MTTNEIDVAVERIRKTAEEEIAKLLEKKQQAAEWPQIGDYYWLITAPGRKIRYRYDADPFDLGCKFIGNICRTEEDAEQALDVLRVVAELNAQPGRCWLDLRRRKFGVFLEDGALTLGSNRNTSRCWRSIYFDTPEHRDAAIKAVGEDRILQAMQFEARWPK